MRIPDDRDSRVRPCLDLALGTAAYYASGRGSRRPQASQTGPSSARLSTSMSSNSRFSPPIDHTNR